VEDVDFVENLEAPGHLDEGLPDFGLVEKGAQPNVLVYLLLDVPRVRQLHYYAEGLGLVVEEGLAVVDYVGVGDGGKYAYLVECVLAFLVPHLSDLDLGGWGGTFFMA